jgi:hypothetical protein
MAVSHVTPHRSGAGGRCLFRRIFRRMTSATPVTLRTRNRKDVTSHRAASVTIKNRMAERRLMPPHFVSRSATRNTAGASVSVAPIVTTTPRGCHKNDKSVRPGLWNTSPTAIRPAPLVIAESDPSEEIWISRLATDVTPGSRLELELEANPRRSEYRLHSGLCRLRRTQLKLVL